MDSITNHTAQMETGTARMMERVDMRGLLENKIGKRLDSHFPIEWDGMFIGWTATILSGWLRPGQDGPAA